MFMTLCTYYITFSAENNLPTFNIVTVWPSVKASNFFSDSEMFCYFAFDKLRLTKALQMVPTTHLLSSLNVNTIPHLFSSYTLFPEPFDSELQRWCHLSIILASLVNKVITSHSHRAVIRIRKHCCETTESTTNLVIADS